MDATAPPFDPVRHRRGGRPRKPDAERRDSFVRVRVTTDELAATRERAQEVGMTVSEFGRVAINNDPIHVTTVQKAPPEVVYQLRAMGHGVDQLLHEARRAPTAMPRLEAAAIDALHTINTALRTVLHGPEC